MWNVYICDMKENTRKTGKKKKSKVLSFLEAAKHYFRGAKLCFHHVLRILSPILQAFPFSF